MQIINPKISIIIPVYNVEQYLARCIDSILAQTFTDFELLLIDDGSKDNSGKICDEYAEKDDRIRVFHKKNDGVSSARNLGLDEASGDWVTFCDADDWVEEDFLLLFKDMMLEGDLLSQGFHSFYEGNTDSYNVFEPTGLYSKSTFIPFLLTTFQTGLLGYVWCKAYKLEIINAHNIRFDNQIHLMEDLVFTLEYCQYINTINNSSKCLYQYKRAPQGKRFKKQDSFYVYKKMYLSFLIIDKNNVYRNKIKSLFINIFLYNLLFVENGFVQFFKYLSYFSAEFNSYIYMCNDNNVYMRFLKKIYIFKNRFWLFANVALLRVSKKINFCLKRINIML